MTISVRASMDKYVHLCIVRVGQNHICTPYMTVCMVIFLLSIPCIHRKYTVNTYIYIYICMALANPVYNTHEGFGWQEGVL